MTKEKYQEERLRKFADYLNAGDLKCTTIYKKLIRANVGSKVREDKTLQPIYFLPIMELPMIFPDWCYNEKYMPVYKGNKESDSILSVIQYFKINRCIFRHLFCSGLQRPEIWGGYELPARPSPGDVANNIYELIEHLQYYATIKGCDFTINTN